MIPDHNETHEKQNWLKILIQMSQQPCPAVNMKHKKLSQLPKYENFIIGKDTKSSYKRLRKPFSQMYSTLR